jgi:hypothetical protein
VHLTAHGDADPDLVWERYAEPARWSSWSPQIRRVEAGPRIVPGLRGVVHGPAGVQARFLVEDVDERARRWRWRVRPVLGVPLPVELVLDHAVDADGRGGATTSLRLSAPSWSAAPLALPAAVLYAPIAQLALHRLVRA